MKTTPIFMMFAVCCFLQSGLFAQEQIQRYPLPGFKQTPKRVSEPSSAIPKPQKGHTPSPTSGLEPIQISAEQMTGMQTSCASCDQCQNIKGCQPRKKFCRLPGVNGYPYESKPINGCKCGHHCQKRLYPHINPHWPRPFANMQKYTPYNCPTKKQPWDVLDVFSNVRLSNYKRNDNGYSGYNCDSFGRLGESFTKQESIKK